MNISFLAQLSIVGFAFKVFLAGCALVYGIFFLFVINQVRSLNRLVFIRPAHTSQLLLILAIVQCLLAFFLFLATVAIL